jgi:hypothetical protein
MKLSALALNVGLGLALAGIVVPLSMLLPLPLSGDWIAAAGITVCVGLVLLARRHTLHD